MSLTTSEMSPADLAAVCGNNRNNDDGFGFGGNGAWWIVILLLFGWGGRGFGNGFGGGYGGQGGGYGYGAPIVVETGKGGCGCSPCATQEDVRQAVDQQTLISKLDQQTYGLADSTYALNNAINAGFNGVQQTLCQGFNGVNTAMMQGFHGVDNAVCTLGYNVQSGFNGLSHQIADCCCDTRAAIKDVGTGVERAGWNLSKQISDCCCDVEKMNMQSRFDAQAYNCNTLQAIDKLGDRIIDYMSNEKVQALRDENQALRLAASQSNQNAVLRAAIDASTAEIIRRTGNDCPVPAYVVNGPTPVNFPTNCCGQVQWGGNCNSGCGGSF